MDTKKTHYITKPNKIPIKAASYRLITLLCTPSKVIEHYLLHKIIPHTPLSPIHHGYRPNHSTTILSTNLILNIINYNRNK